MAAYTQAQKAAFNNRCKQNYHEYNRRISDLEKRAAAGDGFKLIEEIKQLQKQLAARNPKGHMEIDLFGRGPGSTRDKFFQRLNALFSRVNQQNISDLQDHIQVFENRVREGTAVTTSQLKMLNPMLYAVPVKERAGLKRQVDALFHQLKTGAGSPLDDEIKGMNITLADVQKKVKNAGGQKLAPANFKANWQVILETHRAMKQLQQKIQSFQKQVKTTSLVPAVKNTYFNQARKLWESIQACWADTKLQKLSQWIEKTSTENFHHFNSRLQDLEAETLSTVNIKALNAKIKTFEEEMKQTDAHGNYLKPMKYKIHQEMFARTWALKKELQGMWNGHVAASSQEFTVIREQVEKYSDMLDRARTVDEMYQVREQCRQFHQKRRKALADGKLTARDNGRLTGLIQTLHNNAHDLIQIAKPGQFNLDWLQNAHQMNMQNGWVVFVDTVPDIAG